MQLSLAYLRGQHRDVFVVRHPGGDGGRSHVESVVCIRRIFHPAEQRQLELDTDMSGGPGDIKVEVVFGFY